MKLRFGAVYSPKINDLRSTAMAKHPKPLAPSTTLDVLTPQQRRYVEGRATGLSPAAACKAAGLPTSHAPGLERSPNVQAALRDINSAAMQRLQLSRHDVLEGLLTATKAAATATELVAAWREIGKIIGAYEPQKIAVTHEVLLPEQLRVMSDKQLMLAAGMEGVTIDMDGFLLEEGDG